MSGRGSRARHVHVMRGSRNYRQGGSRSVCRKKSLTFLFFIFFSPQLILQKSNGQFQRNLSFFKVQEGVQHFPGGSNFFKRGSNCLFPIETHITSDFPGGGGLDPLSPPLDPHLHVMSLNLLTSRTSPLRALYLYQTTDESALEKIEPYICANAQLPTSTSSQSLKNILKPPDISYD